MLSKTAVVVFILLCALGACSAQSFTNLNFEQGVVEPNDPMFGCLNWSVAVPGWSHSEGADTGIVYYGYPHIGITQWFMLVDRNNTMYSPLSGNYSIAFDSGHSENSPYCPWVNASVFQTAQIPSTARSIRFMATGNFRFTLDGVQCLLSYLGNNTYTADVSAYRGTVCELRFTNMRQLDPYYVSSPVLLDNIAFSTVIVPEPSSLLLLSFGVTALVPIRRLRRRAR